jgi:hypothetical protein
MRSFRALLCCWLVLFAPFEASESAASSISSGGFPVNLADTALTLPGATFKRVITGNVASGDVDLYTGATGKRTLIASMAVFNPTAGPISFNPEVKLSGTYYRLQNVSTNAPAGQSAQDNQAFFPFVLEAGDIISINTSALGLNVFLKMIEYPSSYRVYSPRLTSFAASTNTLYTVPANSSASILGGWSTVPSGTGYCNVTNQTGVTVTYAVHVVPSGNSPGSTNQADGQAMTTLHGNQYECFQTITAGDFIDITSTSATAGQFAWVTVAETTN